MRPRRSPLTSLAVVALLCETVVEAQSTTAPWQESVLSVEELVQKANFGEANHLIDRELENCTGLEEAGQCQAVFYSALGYLHQYAARATGESAQLELARDAYVKALESGGPNSQISNNLALLYRRLGNLKASMKQIRRAIKSDSSRAFPSLLFLAELHREAGQFDKAAEVLEQALDLSQDDEAVYEELFEVASTNPETTIEELANMRYRLSKVEQSRLASKVVENIVWRTFESDPTRADSELLHWVTLQLRAGRLDAAALKALPGPERWSSSAVDELRSVVEDTGADNNLAWWTETFKRRNVIAEVLQHQASDHELRGNDSQAVQILETAYGIAPRVEEYGRATLASAPKIVTQDVAVQLAALYDRTDQDGKFQNLERELFDEKALFYASKNVPAVQRLHTVLGLIYYERGQLASEWADNATFQFEHALAAAQELSTSAAEPVPSQPDLMRFLADSYEKTGRSEDAARLLLDAAEGYSVQRNPRQASEMLVRAEAVGVPHPQQERYTELQRVVKIQGLFETPGSIDYHGANKFGLRNSGEKWNVLLVKIQAEAKDVVFRWARTAASGDVEGHLNLYSENFHSPVHSDFAQWAVSRREHIVANQEQPVEITVSDISVTPIADDRVAVVADHVLGTRTFKTGATKQLVLVQEGSEWKILSEATVLLPFRSP